MLARIDKYPDSNRKYIKDQMARIPCFKELPPFEKNFLIYNCEQKVYKKESVVQKPGEVISHMTIIIKGLVEIHTAIGDHEFKFEYLRYGDILNHTLFMYQHPAYLSIKTVVQTECLIL